MSLGNDAQWYLAALANNNGNSAAAWEKYAHQLEQQMEKLQGDVVMWQAAAVEAGAGALMHREALQKATGKTPVDIFGNSNAVQETVAKLRPVAREMLGADLV